MPIRDVVEAFDEHIKTLPSRFVYLDTTPSLIDRDAVKQMHAPAIASITETDIEQRTMYANQSREEVIRTIVKGVVKYAILSHTWQDAGEFEYRHMVSPDALHDGPGWSKLEHFVKLAKATFKCQLAWADTICIDGTPKEIQAAAEFGFGWFRNAYVCIVYLASTRSLSELGCNKWFRRGWALLELLAPIRIKFYGAGWQPLNDGCPRAENDKADVNFLNVLSKASGVPIDDLRSFLPGPNRVREKLLWASMRSTSVPADTAYCLISIFVSRMEIDRSDTEDCEKAFLRLMLHIIPKSRECDVFAWAGKRAKNHPAIPSSPACYGTQHRDHGLHDNPHRYRLCGDRSFSLGYDHLRIRVVFINVTLKRGLRTGYAVKSRSHKASFNKVELQLESFKLQLKASKAGSQMAIGVIDYDWTDDPIKGEMHEGERYFGFLLQKSSEQARWEKVDTKKVIFLESRETKKHELQVLHLLC